MAQGPTSRDDSSFAYNYLMFSDVHLGAGLVSHVRPWAHFWRHQCAEVDESIATCLDHYETERPGGKPWRLVIVGDFIDFIGMSLPPSRELPSGVTAEERAHGLGSAADHSVLKLRAAADLHSVAFAAFARFLASGNELVLVRGNHDVDFHWPEVQRAFVDLLHEHGPAHVRRETLAAQVRFCPWFYHEPGLLYVEHGHEFDPMCSYGDPLSPVDARDPRRIRWTPSDVMLRYVARPTPGLSTSEAESGTVAAYLRLVGSLGLRGAARVIARFVGAVSRLVRDSFYFPRDQMQAESRTDRLCRYAREYRVDRDIVEAMLKLYRRPAGTTPWELAGRLYLDRFAMLTLAVACLLTALTVSMGTSLGLGLGLAAIAMVVVTGRTPSRTESAATTMRHGAGALAKLLPARFVVMGHTHEPMISPLEGGAAYVNLGHWGQDDLPEDLPSHVRPPCSHLVISTVDVEPQAELRRWDPQFGHRVIAPTAVAVPVAEAPGTEAAAALP